MLPRSILAVCVPALLALTAAGCGGGGGGGDGARAGPGIVSDNSSSANDTPSSAPADDPPAQAQAAITTKNAAIFAELMRFVFSDEVDYLHRVVDGLSVSNDDFLVLPDSAGEPGTETCEYGGTVTYTSRLDANEAYFTLVAEDCSDVQGTVISGQFADSFTNLNQAAHTFDYTSAWNAVGVFDGVTQTSNGSSSIHTEILRRGEHVHEISLDRTTSLDTAQTWSFDLKGTVHDIDRSVHPEHRDSFALNGVSGRVGLQSHGYVDVESADAASQIHMIGARGTESFITLDGDVYAMRYTDPLGVTREVSIDASDIDRLETLDGLDSAPELEPLDRLDPVMIGTTFTLDFNDRVFERDFEPVEFSLAAVADPEDAIIEIEQVSAGVFEVHAVDQGKFHLTLTVTDPQGNPAQRDTWLTVNQDTDGDGIVDASDTDDDNDGVLDRDDAFPTDSTETADADGDGIGDNADSDDDNDGVADDQDDFPFDAECARIEDHTADLCLTTPMARYDDAWVGTDGVLYFLVTSSKTVYRWNAFTSSFLQPWQLGSVAPERTGLTASAYVPAQNRAYFGYGNGEISYVDLSTGVEQHFATLPSSVADLGNAGKFLYARDERFGGEYVYARDGTVTATGDGCCYDSRTDAYDAAVERIYFVDRGLQYKHVDQVTGEVMPASADAEAYSVVPPILFSPAGDLILIGSGNILDSVDHARTGAIPGNIVAGRWSAQDGLIVMRERAGGTALERRDAAYQVVEERSFDGEPRAIFEAGVGYVVASVVDERLVLYPYQPSDDSDGDGVVNGADDFPEDPAASVDTDGDGFPDLWNGGASEADSTSGLALDAYPDDSACYLPEHGDGVTCDVTSALPDYVPDAVVSDAGGIVYLLSEENRRVYRYSATAHDDLAPIVIGAGVPSHGLSPTAIEYVPRHGRLYIGYALGVVTYVDLGDARLEEKELATLPGAIEELGAAGDFLVVQADTRRTDTVYYLDETGAIRDGSRVSIPRIEPTPFYPDLEFRLDYSWSEALRRVYYFADLPPFGGTGLTYTELGVDGTVVNEGRSNYSSHVSPRGPIVMSPDGLHVLLGSGGIESADDLSDEAKLANKFTDAVWGGNGQIVTARDVGGLTRIDRYDAAYDWLGDEDLAGAPLALFEYSDGYLLVGHDGSKPIFTIVAR